MKGELLGGEESIVAAGKFFENLVTNIVGADLYKIDTPVLEYFKNQPLRVTY